MNSTLPAEGPILAIDPGREKCGVAVVDLDTQVLHREIVPSREIAEAASRLVDAYHVTQLVVGDRTAAKDVCRALAAAQIRLVPRMVDEHRSSEQARRRFFQENPPRGWRRLLPVTLLTPDRPYDDLVAVMLAERYLASKT
jgi:RNase H-fold protein (predicted Holliday junction resolvase)